MGHVVTSQLVGDDFPGLIAMTPYQPAEKPFGGLCVPPVLQKNVYDITVLVHGAPQIMLLAPDLHKDLIDVERIAETPVFSPQPLGKFRPELDAPKANRLVAHGDTPLRQQILNIPMAQIESMI